jgi:hypothetical protein
MPTGFQIKKQELAQAVLVAVEKFENETGLLVVELRPQHMKTEKGSRTVQIIPMAEPESDSR